MVQYDYKSITPHGLVDFQIPISPKDKDSVLLPQDFSLFGHSLSLFVRQKQSFNRGFALAIMLPAEMGW